jgi:hypothetical protein
VVLTTGKIRRYFDGVWGYLMTVVRRALVLIGGGSILIIAIGVVEHYFQIALSWGMYEFILLVCVVIAMFSVGLEKNQRLLPRLRIAGDVHRQEWLEPGSGVPCTAFYIDIVNDSTGTSIDNVSVKLTRIDPEVLNLNWLPVPLFIKT